MISAYLNYPSWLRPEIIPGLPIRWYGLMYIVAFSLAFILTRIQVKERSLDVTDDDLSNFFFYLVIGLLVGARIFSVFVYDTSGYYLRKPWRIFWPFDESMRLVGLQGMSYHGGVIGAAVALVIYCRIKKQSIREWGDLITASVPLGFTFGRLGNFFNGELYGRATLSPLGMIFPAASPYPLSAGWVREYAMRLGLSTTGSFVNLPRHPSQLYEAFFEGVFLWLVIWFIFRNRNLVKGAIMGIYLIGFGMVRFFIEYFREPDADLGFVLTLGEDTGMPHNSLLNFTTGQILCFLMIIAGILVIYGSSVYEKKTAQSRVPSSRQPEVQNMRKLRKKLKKRS